MPFDKSFETAQEAAERLGVTVRAIQKQAAAGKIPGAVRHGRAWMIPHSYSPMEKPDTLESNGIPDVYQVSPFRMPLPLMNSPYHIGHALEFINAMADADDRQIALAEYHFFRGEMEDAALIAEPYMNSHDPSLRFSSNLICLCANLSSGHSNIAKFSMSNLQTQVQAILKADAPPLFHAIAIFAMETIAVFLHLPQPDVPLLEEYLRYLPEGLKLYACYILAYKAYLDRDYAKCLAIADISLALCSMLFPGPAIYTHIAAAMALVNMKRVDEARAHMDKAWRIAQPDGVLQPFTEHHGLLQGMVEVYFKKAAPDALPRILEITQTYNKGWRTVHNAMTQRDVADNLTTIEFTIAMLYHRSWSVKEIADHMDISVRTVNRHIATIYEKLGISNRASLARFMLK